MHTIRLCIFSLKGTRLYLQKWKKNRFLFLSEKSNVMVHLLNQKLFLKIPLQNNEKTTNEIIFQRSESWFSDGTEHSLGDEQDTTLHSLPVRLHHTVSHSRHASRTFYTSSVGTALERALNWKAVAVQKSKIGPHPCIISIESALPRVGVWGQPSPAVWRVRRRETFLQLLQLHVHHFCRLRSQEPPFRQKPSRSCSRQGSRCHCQNCCPRHLREHNPTTQNLNQNIVRGRN